MSRIAARFAALRAAGRAALVPYLTAGDPEPGATVPLLRALREAGADLLELGVPFSDPMADGPVIQAACERALAHGVRLADVLEMAAEFRAGDPDTPLILMGYCNPIEAMGAAEFARRAAAAGVDGVLAVDLPPEEAAELRAELTGRGIDPIFLLAPTTSAERMRAVAAAARGFVYYVSLRGTTGADRLDLAETARRVAAVRAHTDLPVGVGFGVRGADDAAAAAGFADAVIVGSALIRAMRAAAAPEAGARAFAAALRAGIDAAGSGA